MDLNSILDKFTGRSFIVYGGTDENINLVKSKGSILIWYTTKYQENTNPPQQLFSRIYDNLSDSLKIDNNESPLRDSIVIVFGTGNVGGMKAEIFASQVLHLKGYASKILIFHGYPGFITTNLTKQTYLDGCIVSVHNDRISTLQELSSLLLPNIVIPVPLRDNDLLVESPLQNILPYIHCVSKIRDSKRDTGYATIPLTEDIPTSIINYKDKNRQMEYRDDIPVSTVHWGQRKLLLSEIEALTEILKRGGNDSKYILVYVGAAPGSHIPYLANLYASVDIEFHLWDRPSRFDIKESSSIRIVPQEYSDPNMTGDKEGFFTDYVAQKYRDVYGINNRIILISDIRDISSEETINDDMIIQKKWVDTIQPYASQLKFRLPYTKDRDYTYINGDIYTQVWSRKYSAETRLLSFRPYTNTIYDTEQYERYMSYFNNNTRLMSYNASKVIGTTTDIGKHLSIPIDGICTCHDCTREIQIVSSYLRYMQYPINRNTITSIIENNTKNSRSKDDVNNTRTLWSIVSPKSSPYDRRHLLLYKTLRDDNDAFLQRVNELWLSRNQNTSIISSSASLDNINIILTSNILVYADNMTEEEVVNALLLKKDRPYIIPETSIGAFGISVVTSQDNMSLFRDVIKGYRPNIVVNFHTDFIDKYIESRDRGIIGMKYYDRFLQSIDIGLLKRENIHKYLILYILSRVK